MILIIIACAFVIISLIIMVFMKPSETELAKRQIQQEQSQRQEGQGKGSEAKINKTGETRAVEAPPTDHGEAVGNNKGSNGQKTPEEQKRPYQHQFQSLRKATREKERGERVNGCQE
jgi:hypothetical protein